MGLWEAQQYLLIQTSLGLLFQAENISQKDGLNTLCAACIPTVADTSSRMHSDPPNPLTVYVISFLKCSQGVYSIPNKATSVQLLATSFQLVGCFHTPGTNYCPVCLCWDVGLQCRTWLVQKHIPVKWGSGGSKGPPIAGTNQAGLFPKLLNETSEQDCCSSRTLLAWLRSNYEQGMRIGVVWPCLNRHFPATVLLHHRDSHAPALQIINNVKLLM